MSPASRSNLRWWLSVGAEMSKCALILQTQTSSVRILQGAGVVNMRAASAASTPNSTQSFAKSTGTWSLDASRGSYHEALRGVTLTGEQDIFGRSFSSAALATAEASRTAWNGRDLERLDLVGLHLDGARLVRVDLVGHRLVRRDLGLNRASGGRGEKPEELPEVHAAVDHLWRRTVMSKRADYC